MTKEEVLQKVNDYCNEKSYTTATLTDAFKDKFADHFQRANAEADVNDETMVAAIKFAINTAFSSASEMATMKAAELATKESALNAQIEELKKKIVPPSVETPHAIPKEIQEQLDELKSYKNEQRKNEKMKNILELAKSGIRSDLHGSFDRFAKDYEVSLDKEDKEQAEALVARYQEIFKDQIGDIKPMKPQQTQKQEEDFIASIPKVKVI